MKLRCPKCAHVATYRERDRDWSAVVVVLGYFVMCAVIMAILAFTGGGK